MKEPKWAQLPPDKRAYRKMKQAKAELPSGYPIYGRSLCDTYLNKLFGDRMFPDKYSKEEQRKINRYRQLSDSWYTLYKEKKDGRHT